MHPVARMNWGWLVTLIAGLIGAACLTQQRTSSLPQRAETRAAIAPNTTATVTLQAAYGKLPLHFETNQGQSDAQVKFLARGSGYTLFLTATGAVLALHQTPDARHQMPVTEGQKAKVEPQSIASSPQSPAALRMSLVGANSQPHITGEAELPGKSHYFLGNNPAQWHTNIPTYAKVKYENVYPGVDLVFYGNQQQLEYDFIVAPGIDPDVIRLAFVGATGRATHASPLHTDTNGDLVLETESGELRFHQPRLYQEINGIRQLVAGRYIFLDSETADSGLRTQHVGFEIVAYDSTKPLIIDPVLVYSTYLGGNGSEFGNDIAVDTAGNAYVAGYTSSTNFPTVNPLQPDCHSPDCYQGDAFVAKLDPTGSTLVYSTYLGGSDGDSATGITVDAAGNASVTGLAGPDFPTTAGAFQPLCRRDASDQCNGDAFAAKLNPTGSALLYSTYLGGSNYDASVGITVDTAGNAYVTGQTYSTDFPTNPEAFDRSCDTDGNCYGSSDGFVTKLNPTGSVLVYSTYLGGSGPEFPRDIAVDAAGNASVTGFTFSTDFPTLNAVQPIPRDCLPEHTSCRDAFVTKLNSAGSALIYSTYLSGSDDDSGESIAVDAAGNTYISGLTSSPDFPTTPGAFQSICRRSPPNFCADAFITKFNATGSALIYSTYLGGSSGDNSTGIAVDATGNVYVTGLTSSPDFPTTEDAFQPTCGGGPDSCSTDAFVTKLNPAGSEIVYSTYLGGISADFGIDVAVDALGNAYVIGSTDRPPDFPTENPLQPTFGGGFCGGIAATRCEAFVAKIAATPQQQGRIVTSFEGPEDGPVSGVAAIRGWAFVTQPDERIASIKLLIDGTPIDDIPCCSERRDVEGAFPEFTAENTLHSGWGMAFNWGLLCSGTHTVRASIRSTMGKQLLTDSRIVTVVKPGDFEYLDQFSLAEATASIARLNDRPVNELVVEGIVVRDKVTQQQKHLNARFRWVGSSQSLGMVEITTVAEAAALRSFFAPLFASLSAWFRGGPAVANAQGLLHPIGFLESPEQEQAISGIGIIRGWAFDEAGSVPPLLGLMIDGWWGGRIPCCSDRADVAAAFPDQPAALHSGWGTVFNYGLLSAGPHTIGVAAEYWSYAKVLGTHAVTVVRVGEFEYLDQFGLSGATARIEGDTLVLSGVVVRDKASQQRKTIDVWLRWVESAQGLGIVAASE